MIEGWVVQFESQHNLLFCSICPKTITSLIYVLTSRLSFDLSITTRIDRFQCRLLINITTGLINHVGYLLSQPLSINETLIGAFK